MPKVSGATSLLLVEAKYRKGDFKWKSCLNGQNVFSYQKQVHQSEMQQSNSEGICNVAKTSTTFQGSISMYFQGHTSALWEAKWTTICSGTPKLFFCHYCWSYSEENICLTRWRGETQNQIFTSWTRFSTYLHSSYVSKMQGSLISINSMMLEFQELPGHLMQYSTILTDLLCPQWLCSLFLSLEMFRPRWDEALDSLM